MEKKDDDSKGIKSTSRYTSDKPLLEETRLACPVTYIVIANWNGKDVIHQCLISLFNNTVDETIKVVVVDNASRDDSVILLQEYFPQVHIIQNQANMGFSVANNQGIRYALAKGAKQILLLNNDIEITESNWLQTFSSIFGSDSDIGVVGCKLHFPDGKIQHAGGVIKLCGAYHRGEREDDRGQYDRVEFMDYVTGAALLIKTEVIEKIGLLDEGFTPLYFEDTDWCVRAGLYSYKIAYTPNPTLIHHCGSSAKKLNTIKSSFYYRRSLIRFFLLNFQTKDILKRILRFEVAALLACFIKRAKKAPFVLRSDASSRLSLFVKAWAPSIRDLRGIIAKRRQRFLLKRKLHLKN